jgi:hypothetical protein
LVLQATPPGDTNARDGIFLWHGGETVKRCCEAEARKHVRKHRDVAICEGCGRLVLGYTNPTEFEKTKEELTRHKVAFEAGEVASVLVIAKDRAPVGAGNGGDDADDDDLDDEDDDDDDAE